jgi:hypothetical protein
MLRGLLNFARTKTGSTNTDPAAGAVHERANRLQINVPAALGDIMGVADPIAELRALTTNFANLCHDSNLPMNSNNYYNSTTFSRQLCS